jgi:membrane protease YdiL (CAAX protease family)/uncharacterized RDD family membrane protein YckC
MSEGDLAPTQAPTVVFGGFGRRLGAALLDSVVWLIAIGWITSAFPQDFFDDHTLAAGLIFLGLFSAWFNYFAIAEWRWGQTIGKNALGLRVVPVDAGAKLTYNAAALRNLLRLVDLPLTLIGVDYFIVRNSPRRQRLGDRAAHTVVLREEGPGTNAPPDEGPPSSRPPPPRGPTAGELFPDAAGALQQPGVGAGPSAGAATGTPSRKAQSSLAGAPATAPAPGRSEAPSREAGSFPYATWGPRTAIVGLLVALGLAIALGIPALVIDNPAPGEDFSTAANIAAQLAQVLAFIAVPIYIATRDGASLRPALERLGVRSFRWSAFGWMAAAIGAYLVLIGLYSLVVKPDQEDIAPSFGPIWVQVFLIVICAATSEELCFRGMLFGGLRTRLPSLAAATVSGLIFGALHAPTGVSAVPPLIVFGMVMALLYERTGSILPGVILHALNNSVALLAQ